MFLPRLCTYALFLVLTLLTPALAGNSAGNFGGVGIDGAPWTDGQIVVRQLVTGGPAHLAGIKIGDIITHIDGKPTKGSNFSQMVNYRLRGQAGTKVALRVRRPGMSKPLAFELIRRQLVLPKGGKTSQVSP
ncbi:S41 family peptidase [Geobacter sp. AOG1]|uniref:S41 family peptidase n=1 Tax=Geobacter sp. AOG1 TaxID=1566346 RepID=UPI001CC81F35|nr:PDZ domain-containing protein [Geobacter sp. AOG1]